MAWLRSAFPLDSGRHHARPRVSHLYVGLRMRAVFRIETPSLVLRPLVLGDTQRMLEMSQEDCARQWLPSQIYRDERHAGTAIEYLIGQFNLDASPTTNAFVFGVEEKATGRLIGHVGLSPFFDTVLRWVLALPHPSRGRVTRRRALPGFVPGGWNDTHSPLSWE